MWDGWRLTPKLFVASSLLLVVFSLFAIAGSAGAAWSFVIAGAAWVYILLMASLMSDRFNAGWLFVFGVGSPLARAARLAGARRYAEALEISERYTRRHPRAANGWLASASALLGLGRLEESLECADRAIDLGGPRQARWIRGYVLYSLGLFEEAVDDLLAEGRIPAQPFVLVLGSALVSVRRLDEAVEVLDHMEPKSNPQRLLQVGETQRLLGEVTKATEAYARAAETTRAELMTEPLLEGTLAYCLARLQSYEEASAVANSALSKRPHDLHALGAVVVVAIGHGSMDTAHVAISKMLVASPSAALGAFRDPDSAMLLTHPSLRTLFAWTLGAQRQARARVRERSSPRLFS